MLGGILIITAILIVGAVVTTRRARRQDRRLRDESVRSGGDGSSDVPAFMLFGSDASRGSGHEHYPGDPVGDWPTGFDGGASGGAGASGSIDSGGGGDAGGGDGGGGSD